MDQVQLRAGKQTDLFVNGLDHARVDLKDFGHASSPSAKSVSVMGGDRLAAGERAEGRTNIFSGASSGNIISYDVSRGANVLVRDLWYESGAGAGFANIHDRATFTVDGVRISSPSNATSPAFNIVDLKGSVAVVAADLDDRITISGNGSAARVLGLAVFDEQESASYFTSSASPVAQALLINSRHRANGGRGNRSIPTPNVGSPDGTFIESLLSRTRAETIGPLVDSPPEVTDFRMLRVWVADGLNNVVITP
jgi:hypothetical protein